MRAYGCHQVWVLPELPGLPHSPVRVWEGASPGRDLPLLLLLSLLHAAEEVLPSPWLIGLLRGPQIHSSTTRYFPGGSDDKASAYNAGDVGSISGLGRSSGEGNGNPLWYFSCLENPMDRGA